MRRVIPVVIAAVLAGCSKPSTPSSTSAAPTAESNVTQHMDTFTMAGYAPDGTKRWEMEGTGATIEGQWVRVNQPNGVGYDEATAYLTASLAHVDQTSRRVRLEHDVVIHTSDGLWLSSPEMFWLPDREELVTDRPVRIESDHMLLRGYEATGHSQLKRAVIKRDIELILNPSEHDVPGGPSHVKITCDGPLAFEYEQGIATFNRNVHVIDGQNDLYSDKLVAYMDKRTRTILFAEAIGNVRIEQGGQTAYSERAVYEPAKGKMTLLGAPSLLVTQDGKTQAMPSVPARRAPAPMIAPPLLGAPIPIHAPAMPMAKPIAVQPAEDD